jgi:hypothetical protein
MAKKKKIVIPDLATLDEFRAWLAQQSESVPEEVIQKALEQVR